MKYDNTVSMYGGQVQPDTKPAVMKSKLSEKEPYQNSENEHNFETPDLVSLSQFMRVNEKYAHRSEPICPQDTDGY